MEEVVSSFKGCQGQKEGRTSSATCKAPIWQCLTLKEQSSWEEGNLNRTKPGYHEGGPPKGAGCMAAALEGEIERLSHPLSQRQLEVRVRSKSKDHQMHGSMEHKRWQCQVWFSNIHTTYQLARESPAVWWRGSQSLRIQIWVSCWS